MDFMHLLRFFSLSYFLFIRLLAPAIVFTASLYSMEIALINVAQGNGVVITYPGKPTILNDLGYSQLPRTKDDKTISAADLFSSVKEYIEAKTPTKKLVIIASHADKDHCKMIPALAKYFIAKKYTLTILLGGAKKDYKKEGMNFKKLEKLCKKEEITYNYTADIKNIDKFAEEYLPDYCSVLASNPKESNPNNRSIILRVADGQDSFLLTGDAEKDITDSLDAKTAKSTGFLLSHHGTDVKGCTNLQLIEKISPEYIFVSNGMYGGSYHHMRFGALKAACDYFKRKKDTQFWHPHTINYSYPPRKTFLFAKDKTLNSDKNHKPVIKYIDEFATAVTSYPIFSTVNNGTINVGPDYLICERQNDETVTKKSVCLASLNAKYFGHNFDTIAELNLTNLGLTDTDIKTYFKALPTALSFCNLSKNKLGIPSIIQFAELLAKRDKALTILLKIPYKQENQEDAPILKTLQNTIQNKENTQERLLNSLKRISEKKKMITQANIWEPQEIDESSED